MNKETKAALEMSILKWERIVSGSGSDLGTLNCNLCDHFMYENCSDCPVSVFTKKPLCCGSPYIAWHKHHDDHNTSDYIGYIIQCPACKDLAQKELDFLKSLRET